MNQNGRPLSSFSNPNSNQRQALYTGETLQRPVQGKSPSEIFAGQNLGQNPGPQRPPSSINAFSIFIQERRK